MNLQPDPCHSLLSGGNNEMPYKYDLTGWYAKHLPTLIFPSITNLFKNWIFSSTRFQIIRVCLMSVFGFYHKKLL